MRLQRTKTGPEGMLHAVTDSFAALRHGEHRGTLVKAATVAAGVAVLTAGSAAVSSLRRRLEADS